MSHAYQPTPLASVAQDQSAWGGERWVGHLLLLFNQGRCLLPCHMGLGEWRYLLLCRDYGCDPCVGEVVRQRQALLSELAAPRAQEQEQLQIWLQQFVVPEASLMAELIATACLGFSHLWQDLGLDSRQELKSLMQACFPELVARNVNNMRWKKFFYREQCQEEGGLVCRSPSCDICPSYDLCFVTETH